VVNKEVNQQFSGGAWHCNTRNLCYSLNVNNLGKKAVLHFAFSPFCGWGHTKLSLLIWHSCAYVKFS
jgi:hypothetical protein